MWAGVLSTAGGLVFSVDGKQHVAVSGGHALFVFALEQRQKANRTLNCRARG